MARNKVTQTFVETIIFSKDEAMKWVRPDFQRPLKVNHKVEALATQLKVNGGIIPGIVTFGQLRGDKTKYIIDGAHRREAFLISGLDEGYADTRLCFFDTMSEMGEEFVSLNSSLVKMRPDDNLRGLEGSLDTLKKIRDECPFVGYDYIRRCPSSPIVSMSQLLRSWAISSPEVPISGVSGGVISYARNLAGDETANLIRYLKCAIVGFGRDHEYVRLWGALNMSLCMWLYRRIVLTSYSPKTQRINDELFGKCLMSLSANGEYLDWLVGRNLGERDRGPAMTKIRAIFTSRLLNETGKKHNMPLPAWCSR